MLRHRMARFGLLSAVEGTRAGDKANKGQKGASDTQPLRATTRRSPQALLDELVVHVAFIVVFVGVPYILPSLPALFGYLIIVQMKPKLAVFALLLWCYEVAAPPRDALWPYAITLLRYPLWCAAPSRARQRRHTSHAAPSRRHTWRQFFRYELISESSLDPHGLYVFASHPHGVFPMAQWLTIPLSCDPDATTGADAAIRAAFPMPLRGAAASVLLRLPLLRHVLQWAGIVPASGDVMRELLRHGTSVVLVPGGIAEIYVSDPHSEALVLQRRMGFVRLAAETGAHLVPIYCFGNSGCFRVRPPPPRFASACRRARVGLQAFWGRWHLPLPFRVKILVVVGTPLQPQQGESVESLHGRYTQAVVELFDRHKGRMGPDWAAKTLHIT